MSTNELLLSESGNRSKRTNNDVPDVLQEGLKWGPLPDRRGSLPGPGWDDAARGGETEEVELVDEAARRRLAERFGPRAVGWCYELPALVERLGRRWGVEVVRSVSNGNTACVFVCGRRGGGDAVLKLSPDRDLLVVEASALRAFGASGRVPEVLGFDGEAGALLMEAVAPGTMLADEGTEVRPEGVVALVRALHDAPDEDVVAGFPPLIELVEFFFRFWGGQSRKPEVADAVPRGLLERSLAAARELALRPGPKVLLHGDLHPRNVLDGGPERGYVAIDPRACVGDPAFDLIDWVFRGGGDEAALARRAERLAAEAVVDPASLRRWCACTAVLDAISRLVRGDRSGEAVPSLLALADAEL